MTSQPPDYQELLSGMLDGMLTSAEVAALERLMQENPALQQQLDELAALRSSLLRGRPTGRLPKNFAARVVNGASERASEMELDSPSWIPSVMERTPPPAPKLEPSYRQRVWIPVAAAVAATTIAILAVVIPRGPDPIPVALLPPFDISTNVQPGGDGTKDAEVTGAEAALDALNHLAEASKEGELPGNEELEKGMSPEAGAVAISPNKVEESTLLTQGGASMSLPLPTAPVPDVPVPVVPAPAVAGVEREAPAPSAVANAQTKIPSETPFMLMAIHVSVDAVAAENGALHTILGQHDIVTADDLAISEKELGLLLSTGLANSISDRGSNIYFLKGYARNLAGAIEDICHQYKDFPEFSFNIVMDDSAQKLVEQLEEIGVGEAPTVAAKLGVKTAEGLASTFGRGETRFPPLSEKRRSEFASSKLVPKIDLNPVTHMLLIVRDYEEPNNSTPEEPTAK